jgi:hypothetical protein
MKRKPTPYTSLLTGDDGMSKAQRHERLLKLADQAERELGKPMLARAYRQAAARVLDPPPRKPGPQHEYGPERAERAREQHARKRAAEAPS